MSGKSIILSLLILLMAAFIITFPSEALEAAGDSLQLWFNRVLPSLLPFMIGMNILSVTGFTEIAGKWLNTLMKVFGVPGESGFALAAGMTSGYPMGAKITAGLRENMILTQTEAQRLISFANNSGPLFILGAVGISMYNSKSIGYFLMLAHYMAAFITGLLFKSYKADDEYTNRPVKTVCLDKENKPLGLILSQSVMDAMNSMALIGGFIIFFGVLCKCILMIPFFSRRFSYLAAGLLEMTNGLYFVQNSGLPLNIRVSISAALISFGGLSIHAQTISMISKTDIKASIYLLSKIIQAIISLIIGFTLYPVFFNRF